MTERKMAKEIADILSNEQVTKYGGTIKITGAESVKETAQELSSPTVEKPQEPKYKVLFEYDEQAGKWEVYCYGAKDEYEALDMFCAVVVTARSAIPSQNYNKAILENGRYKISVGVL